MKGIQSKINKLVLAFLQKEIIVKISTNQSYSLKFKKMFTNYSVKFTTETEILLRKELYALRTEYKGKSKPFRIKNRIEELKAEIKEMTEPQLEFKNKIEMLIYLSERYKELVV